MYCAGQQRQRAKRRGKGSLLSSKQEEGLREKARKGPEELKNTAHLKAGVNRPHSRVTKYSWGTEGVCPGETRMDGHVSE